MFISNATYRKYVYAYLFILCICIWVNRRYTHIFLIPLTVARMSNLLKKFYCFIFVQLQILKLWNYLPSLFGLARRYTMKYINFINKYFNKWKLISHCEVFCDYLRAPVVAIGSQWMMKAMVNSCLQSSGSGWRWVSKASSLPVCWQSLGQMWVEGGNKGKEMMAGKRFNSKWFNSFFA